MENIQGHELGLKGLHSVVIDIETGKKKLTNQAIDLFPNYVKVKEVKVKTDTFGVVSLIFQNILAPLKTMVVIEGFPRSHFRKPASLRWIRCKGFFDGKEKQFILIFSEVIGESYLYELSKFQNSGLVDSVDKKPEPEQYFPEIPIDVARNIRRLSLKAERTKRIHERHSVFTRSGNNVVEATEV